MWSILTIVWIVASAQCPQTLIRTQERPAADIACSWACNDPVCIPICAPRCSSAQCTVDCTPGHSCTTTPVCHVECPYEGETTLAVSGSCPACETICNPLPGSCMGCTTVCNATNCDWSCQPPSMCERPQCELQCQSPACSAALCWATRIIPWAWAMVVILLFAVINL